MSPGRLLPAILAVAATAAVGAIQETRTIWNAAGDGATVSPDGKLVAFVDWDSGDVAVFETATGQTRRVTNKGGWDQDRSWADPSLVFSPRGDRIAFAYANALGGDPYRYELRVVGVADSAQQVLAALPARAALIAPLDWHPRTGILFAAAAEDESSELRIVQPDDRSVRVLHRRNAGAGVPYHGLFMPDGRAVVFLANGELYQLASDDRPRALGLRAETLLGWDDRGRLLFHAARGGRTGNWVVSLGDGVLIGEPTLVVATGPGVMAGGRNADGAHYVEPIETPRLYLATVNVAAGRILEPPRPITPEGATAAGNPSWSRDGASLAYTMKVANRTVFRVMVAAASGGVPRQIAQVNLRVMGLDWSPDGTSLVIAGRGESRGSSWVGRIAVADGAIDRLVTEPASAVAAGPNGDIAYVRAALADETTVHVVFLPADAKASRVLATFPVAELPRSVSISPDGKWVAILKPVDQRRGSVLELLPVAGGEPRTLLRVDDPDALQWAQGSIPWTADGQRILVSLRRQGETQLAAIRVDSRELTPLPMPFRETSRRQPALHPDGRRLVYVDGVLRSELRVTSGSGRR
jgi:Tol biopolymer transport system component